MRPAAVIAFSLAFLQAADRAAIDPERYLGAVQALSAPSMRGRGTGSPELDKAAEYIAAQFRAAELEPADGQGYFIPFPIATEARLGSANRLTYRSGGESVPLRSGEDFLPFSFSANRKLTAELVFAGYGISAPEYGYDDYAGIDVRGKAVVILRHEPQEFEEKSVFAGRIYTEHAQFFSKAVNARAHGAAAVILVHDISNHSAGADELEKFSTGVGPADAGLPYVQVKSDIADRWLAAAGNTVRGLGDEIDRDLHPRSFKIPAVSITLETQIRRSERPVRNVAAYLPGETDEYVVIGAHYDHLGLGEQFSMSPSEAGKAIHPGADDNASGTAGVIELARRFAARPKGRRGVLFLCFAGEELGLLGSSFYVHHPALPPGKAVAMINLDMIGRMRDRQLLVGGAMTGSGLRELVERAAAEAELTVDLADTTGYGSSDHTAFTTLEIPVLFFFTGLHADYHRPSDTWDKIDPAATATLLEMVARIAESLRDAPGRPVFNRTLPAG
jgi:Zn-dependent M28 family amino/carboxypeptidase